MVSPHTLPHRIVALAYLKMDHQVRVCMSKCLISSTGIDITGAFNSVNLSSTSCIVIVVLPSASDQVVSA